MHKIFDPEPLKHFGSILFSIVGLLLAGLVAIHGVTHIPFEKFTADPAATFNYNPIFGFISNIGILLWCTCTSVCLFSAAILSMEKGHGQTVRFLICFGILSGTLMLDDLFMFHESFAPNYLSISEKWVILAYGMYSLACFYHFRRVILASNKRYLIVAVIALGSSVLVDQISSRFYFPGEFLVEDGLKLAGIASWLAYFVELTFHKISAMIMTQRVYKMRHTQRREGELFTYN